LSRLHTSVVSITSDRDKNLYSLGVIFLREPATNRNDRPSNQSELSCADNHDKKLSDSVCWTEQAIGEQTSGQIEEKTKPAQRIAAATSKRNLPVRVNERPKDNLGKNPEDSCYRDGFHNRSVP